MKDNNYNEKIAMITSSWFFIGFAPFAPGTFGTIAAIPLCFAVSLTNITVSTIILISMTLVAIWSSHITEKIKQKKDPGEIVIDEVVGMLFAMFSLSFTLSNLIISFILFRMIDISKPQPIRLIEKKVPGGFGVVLDDILAGITGNLITRILVVCCQPQLHNY